MPEPPIHKCCGRQRDDRLDPDHGVEEPHQIRVHPARGREGRGHDGRRRGGDGDREDERNLPSKRAVAGIGRGPDEGAI